VLPNAVVAFGTIMWHTQETEEYVRRLKQFAKKHRTELIAMLDNLDTYFQTLQSGSTPETDSAWIHS